MCASLQVKCAVFAHLAEGQIFACNKKYDGVCNIAD